MRHYSVRLHFYNGDVFFINRARIRFIVQNTVFLILGDNIDNLYSYSDVYYARQSR